MTTNNTDDVMSSIVCVRTEWSEEACGEVFLLTDSTHGCGLDLTERDRVRDERLKEQFNKEHHERLFNQSIKMKSFSDQAVREFVEKLKEKTDFVPSEDYEDSIPVIRFTDIDTCLSEYLSKEEKR